MMTTRELETAETVDPRTAVAMIEGWFDGNGFPPDGRGVMLVQTSDNRMIAITIEDVTG